MKKDKKNILLTFRANEADIRILQKAQEKLNAKNMSDTFRKAIRHIAVEL